ncbi:hypothetical protein VNI00_012005 [Paramarasmius palmivorus]|uniref:Uncharacterized protein n=1 Tax=Paramarasmius palmivorus TaxID=297713 RepID=A0AAW0CA88_9AGAR
MTGWLKDLKDNLARDPIRIAVENKDFASKDRVEFLANQVLAVGWENLLDDIHTSSKLNLLKSRHPRLRLNNGKAFKVPEIQNYLLVPIDRHRKALTKLMTSTHNLAVEVFRWKQRKDGSPINREERLCRFCHECVEDEVHAVWDSENGVAAINLAADSSGLCIAFARLVYGVLETFDSVPVYIPDQAELHSREILPSNA